MSIFAKYKEKTRNMLQDYENLSSHSISEDEKRSQKAKKKSFSLDYEGKVSNMSDLQMLLKTADSLLQNNKIKEALKLYEHSIYYNIFLYFSIFTLYHSLFIYIYLNYNAFLVIFINKRR